MHYYTTYFDENYLTRGLVLYESLKEHEERFTLYILCLDKSTLQYFSDNASRYPEVKVIPLSEIESSDQDLYQCKNNRSRIEYYFTLSPCLPLYLLKKLDLPHICSLDADILLLGPVQEIFNFLNDHSIIITPHKFSNEIKDLILWGKYNVSFQVFKNDATGVRCLEYWREQCIEWCGDYYDEENNRFADQKYLDDWSELYPGMVKVLDDSTSGLAPWNLNNYKITFHNNAFYSNGERIIFYHFHHFKFFNNSWSSNGFNLYFVKTSKSIGKLYLYYWKKVKEANKKVQISKDQSARQNYSENTWQRIFSEKVVFFNLMNKRLLYLNFTGFPVILKRIIIKLNG